MAGPTVRADTVTSFGEDATRHGWYGVVRADELLPLLFSHANRPSLLGHRLTVGRTAALPDHPEAMPISPVATTGAGSEPADPAPSGTARGV